MGKEEEEMLGEVASVLAVVFRIAGEEWFYLGF